MWGQKWGQMIWHASASSAVPALGAWASIALGGVLLVVGYRFAAARGVRPRTLGLFALTLAVMIPVSGALAALPFTFINGAVADANQVNANFNSLDARVSTAITTVSDSELNTTDLPSASWQFLAGRCISVLEAEAATMGLGERLIPDGCTLGAKRKCQDLGYAFGFFVGEQGSNASRSIKCIK